MAARHVCILFRRFKSFRRDMTRPYVEALEARDLPHHLVGGPGFHDREEVTTMRAALAAVEHPDDDLSVFATLRGSLFAVDDATLLEYRQRFGRLHPYRIPAELLDEDNAPLTGELAAGEGDDGLRKRLGPIAKALAVLRDAHRRRNRVPVAETVDRLLDATRAHAGFVMRPGGEQVLANVLRVAELARRYEAGGGLSFRGFVEQLESEALAGRAGEASILEGRQRRRAHHERAPGQGARVPGGGPRRPHVPTSREGTHAFHRCTPGAVRVTARRLDAPESPRPPGRRAGAGPPGGHPDRLRRRDPGPRSAGGAGGRRRTVRGETAGSAQAGMARSALPRGLSPAGRVP